MKLAAVIVGLLIAAALAIWLRPGIFDCGEDCGFVPTTVWYGGIFVLPALLLLVLGFGLVRAVLRRSSSR